MTRQRVVLNFVLSGFVTLFLSCMENETATHSDVNAAADTGAIDLAWVPDCLPRSAKNIDETHNLDTNSAFGKFSFDRGDTTLPQRNLRPTVRELNIRFRQLPPGWPAELAGRISVLELRNKDFLVAECPINKSHTIFDSFVVVLDRKNLKGYFWTERFGAN